MKTSKDLKMNNVWAGPVSARRERGITLVALIITIIVMLVLVGVSVQVVINSNLIGTAQDAVNSTETAYEEEASTGEITVGDKTYESIEDYMEGKIKLEPGETATEGNATYKGITIPKGFTVSKIEGEYEDVEQGLVIYDLRGVDSSPANFWTETVTIGGQTYPKVQTLYNQFVWVPVKEAYITAEEISKIITNNSYIDTADYTANQQAINYLINQGRYPMAVQLDNGKDYRGILYGFAAGTDGVTITSWSDFSILSNESYDYNISGHKTYYREPGTNEFEYTKNADGTTLTYNTIGLTQEKLKIEYNTIVEKVDASGGFYVARYELTGNSTDGYGSKRGQNVANASSSSAYRWHGLYSACQGMYNQTTDKVQSTMISGAQWDQIMIWMKDVKNTNDTSKYYVVDSSYMGNYNTATGGTGAIQVSGYLDNYSVKKVFDLGGNLFEWTTEVYLNSQRVGRGRHFNSSGAEYPAISRGATHASGIENYRTARAALYVK